MADVRMGATAHRPEFGQRAIDIPGPGAAPRPAQPEAAREPEGSKLIVGRNIQLKGEIQACDTLVVEGRVEASMKSRVIEIDESGLFSGSAEVENADVRGRFEGELVVNGRLSVHATGRVSGTIRYGEIIIASGGQITGDVQLISEKRGGDKSAAASKSGAWQADKPAVAAKA